MSSVCKKLFLCLLALLCGFVSAQAQTDTEQNDKEQLTIILAGGRTLVVDEVSESQDGFWYKRGNMTTFLDRERVLRVEYPKPPEAEAGPLEGAGKWRLADAARIKEFFEAKFKRPLPTTAFGQSDLHTRWGLDHRNGMDVGLHPDSVEGRALIEFCETNQSLFWPFAAPCPV